MALEIFKLVGSVFVDTDKAEKSLKKTDKQASGFGKTLGNGIKAAGKFALGVGSMAVAAGGALVALTESTREYRTEQGKLEAAFKTAGFESDEARKTYEELNGILGDSGQAVEASNHLAKLCTTTGELADWTTICTGVYATFGDSLPIEGLTEAANETAKTGALTGSLADALNWAGVNEDDFQASLDACTTEQERQALITETLTGLYGEAADAYKDANAEVIAANKAQDRLNKVLAKVGGAFEPAITAAKNMGASLLEELVPGVTTAADALSRLISGDEGAAGDLGTALSDLLTKALDMLLEMVPELVDVAISLIGTFTTTLIEKAPEVLSAVLVIGGQLLTGLGDIILQMAEALGESIPDIVKALQDGLPVLLEGLVSLLTSLAESIDLIVQPLLDVLPDVITLLVDTLVALLPVLIPLLIDVAISLVSAIIEALPEILTALWDAIVTLCGTLPETFSAIWQGVVDVIMLVVEPIVEFFSGVWDDICEVFTDVGTWFSEAFTTAWDNIETAFEDVTDFFDGVWEDICDAFVDVGTWFTDTFDTAWDNIETAFDSVGEFFDGVYDSITGAFENITTWFSETFSDAWQAVKDVFSTGGAIFENIKEGLADVFTDTVNSIIRGINKVIAVPFNSINTILSGIRNISILGLTPFSGIGSVGVPVIPELEEGAVLEKGQRGFLEGNGAEAVVPLHKNQEWISAVAKDMDSALGASSGERVLAILLDILAAIEELVGAGIYLDTGALVGGLARPLDRKLGQIQAAKGRA